MNLPFDMTWTGILAGILLGMYVIPILIGMAMSMIARMMPAPKKANAA